MVVAATGLSARSAADRFGFAACSTSVETIWRDGDCDAVVIATRHDSHAQLTIDALEAGKAVFVEKPLCITEAELDRIVHVRGHAARGRAGAVRDGRIQPPVRTGGRGGARARWPARRSSIVYRVNAGRLAPRAGSRVRRKAADASSERCVTSSISARTSQGRRSSRSAPRARRPVQTT